MSQTKKRTRTRLYDLDLRWCVHFARVISIQKNYSTTIQRRLLILILNGLARFGALRSRTTSLLGEDSYCRGSIVRTRNVFSRERRVRRESSKALWRFRVSTSNSPSDRSRLHAHTPIRYIYQTYAQQDIRVYEDDHCEPHKRQFLNPRRFDFFA